MNAMTKSFIVNMQNEKNQQLMNSFRKFVNNDSSKQAFLKDLILQSSVSRESVETKVSTNKNIEKEVRYNANGTIKFIREFVYDEDGRVILEEYSNEKNETTSYTEYFYGKNGSIEKYIRYDGIGNVQKVTSYQYDSLNNIVSRVNGHEEKVVC